MCKDKIKQALSELYALVNGECPRLLDEDRGGDAQLDWEIRKALTALDALHTYNPTTHVVVPREPTDEMYNAGSVAFNEPLGQAPANSRTVNSMRMYNAYKAMISATEVKTND